MKKEYVKPIILFESISLSTNIAADCENKTHLPAENQCGIWLEGVGNVFITGMTGCNDYPVENEKEDFNGICYRVRIEGGLKAGEIRQIMPSHFSSEGSRIMFVTVG